MMVSPSEKDSAFLDVENSLSDKRWVERLDVLSRNQALAIAQSLGVPDIISRVMAGRSVGLDDAEKFLDPSIRDLMPDPSVLTDMNKAAERLADAITQKQRIAIFGDYDVDGAASSALLARFLTSHDIEHEIYIPDRIFEGYGPNPEAIKQLIENGAQLIVTVDCGATSFEALEEAMKLGIDVIVLDHHQMGVDSPPATALVNPNRQDDLSGLDYLCAAGVVFMTLVAVQRVMRSQDVNSSLNLLDLLDLVALATVCDVVPLQGLNRAFVTKGLQVMRQQKNSGLAALAKVSRLDEPMKPYHLGFLLGPRINAGGRIGDAALGSRLLASDDQFECEKISTQLDQLNSERQAAEAIMLEEAISEGEAEMGSDESRPSVLVTQRKGWHPGIVGLLASRLKDRFKCPTFAIAFDGNGKGSGSGRSIAGVDLGKAVREAVSHGILEKGGGHAMAAGLTIRHEKLGEFRAFMDEQLREEVSSSHDHRVLKIDGALSARGATLELCELLDKAGPYGAGNSQPIFVFPDHLLKYSKMVGRDHVSVTLANKEGVSIRAIGFRMAEEKLGQALLNGQGQRFHFAGTISINHWQGRRNVQLRIMDAQMA